MPKKQMDGRGCDGCTMCCRLLPVNERKFIGPAGFYKPANALCLHQCIGAGCAVYGKSAMPMSCRKWNCAYLADADARDLGKPEITHYVVDTMPDFIEAGGQQFPVVQVWCDPAFREAWRDPALLAYLDHKWQSEGMLALVRYSSKDAFPLIPPSASPTKDWYIPDHASAGRDHTFAEINEALEPK